MWGDVVQPTPWGKGLQPTGFADGVPFFAVPVKPTATHVGLLIYKGDAHSGEEKAAGARGALRARGRRPALGGQEGGTPVSLGAFTPCHRPQHHRTPFFITGTASLPLLLVPGSGVEHLDPSSTSQVWLAQADQHAYGERPDMNHVVPGSLFKAYANCECMQAWRTGRQQQQEEGEEDGNGGKGWAVCSCGHVQQLMRTVSCACTCRGDCWHHRLARARQRGRGAQQPAAPLLPALQPAEPHACHRWVACVGSSGARPAVIRDCCCCCWVQPRIASSNAAGCTPSCLTLVGGQPATT